ncbi:MULTISPECIES: hypothetical protein [unclassified Streptomyces]|uniref:hypothetical protein n=1 Tax=unclassified Streptomyces TaxID=2593676 RepID=UPI0018EE850E|nr:hypothetical protein [Streptomyces sp. I5]MBJ6634880.1 hypothetical protein [Streptomyces sp. I5]MBJ6634881.1 hypothetical protein [Streptomyces sp. I5]
MSGERLPVAEPADVRRAAGELVRAGRALPLTDAKASASGPHRRLLNEPEHRHRVAQAAQQDTPEEVAR